MEGIYCGNFSTSRGLWPPCQNTWHAERYTSQGDLPKFPTMSIEDEMGNPWHREEERQRRLGQGVDGAHMCTPFQCEVCWVRNLEGKEVELGRDDVYLACIRRSNFDAMLRKSPLTIENHARESRAAVKNAELINKTPSYHQRGPFPLTDTVGMGLVIDMQLDQGARAICYTTALAIYVHQELGVVTSWRVRRISVLKGHRSDTPYVLPIPFRMVL